MIIGIHGYFGSGKTLMLMIISYFAFKAGYTIYTNFKMNIPYTSIDLDELSKYAVYGRSLSENKTCISFDEMQYYLDCRASIQNTINTYFLFQTRKRNVILVYTASKRGLNDNRLRDATNICILCEKYHFENRKICFNDRCELRHFFKFYIIDIMNRKGKTIIIKNPEEYYELYDTYEILSPVIGLTESEIEKMIGKL